MARNDQVSRILKVISLLERNPSGFSVSEIHRRLLDDGIKCSIRSVYRDLDAIERVHFPVVREGSGEDSRWRLNSVAALSPNIQISYRELLALFIARNTISAMKGSPVHDAIESFFDRIEKVLGPGAKEGLAELETYIGFKARPMWHAGISQEVIDTVHNACAEGHVLQIDYRAASGDNKGEVKARRVGPEQIFFGDSGMYLIATDLSSGAIKMYSLARIASAVLLPDHYDRHGDGVVEIMQSGIGVLSSGSVQEVILEIEEPIASYVSERRWHDSQTVTRTASGIVLKMQVKVNDELVRWVLGLGPAATISEPKMLQDLVCSAAEAIAEKINPTADGGASGNRSRRKNS